MSQFYICMYENAIAKDPIKPDTGQNKYRTILEEALPLRLWSDHQAHNVGSRPVADIR